MNTLSSYSMVGPYGKEDVCAKFDIDDINSIFVFNDIVVPGQEYAFGCWLKSEADGSIIVGDEQIACSAEDWVEVSVVFTASSEEVPILFGTEGTYYIYQAKLEKGNTVTDWSPAPEDVDKNIINSTDNVRTEMILQQAETLELCDELIGSVLDDYVEEAEYTSFKETVQTDFAIMDDEITMNFTTIEGKVYDIDGEVQAKFQELNKHISFSDDGIVISAGENAMSIRIDNDIVKFEKNGAMFGWWDGVDFHTGNIYVEVEKRAQFGNFAYVPRNDGSLSFLKVGEMTNGN